MQQREAYPSAACAPLMGSAGPLIRMRATSDFCSTPTQRSLLSSLSVMYCIRLQGTLMGSGQHGTSRAQGSMACLWAGGVEAKARTFHRHENGAYTGTVDVSLLTFSMCLGRLLAHSAKTDASVSAKHINCLLCVDR